MTLFVIVFAIVAGAQFFMVAGPSVGAVKHSGVFSCDWDSLEEENVRHGAWMSVCWSSSGGLREDGQSMRQPGQSGAFLCIQPTPCFPFSLASILFFLLFSSPSSSLSPLPSLNGGSSLVIH